MAPRLSSDELLLCFAVKEEAIYARGLSPNILITGMGSTNARQAVEKSLPHVQPKLVLSCGFAGGLNPELKSGDVIFQADDQPALSQALQEAQARPAAFHFASRIASTAQEKQALRKQTGADAVEMESQVIRELCQSQGIPCVTLRVISDTAEEDLPLDFNRLVDSHQNLRLGKLLITLAGSPGKIPALIRLQRTTRQAARRLAAVLRTLIQT